MSDLEKLKTEIALLKKDAKTGELIHQRLEVAVDKLTEITISLKGTKKLINGEIIKVNNKPSKLIS